MRRRSTKASEARFLEIVNRVQPQHAAARVSSSDRAIVLGMFADFAYAGLGVFEELPGSGTANFQSAIWRSLFAPDARNQVPRERWLPSARGYPDFRCPSFPALLRSCVLSEVSQEQVVFSGFDPIEGRKRELARLDVDPSDSFWDLSPDGSRIAFGKFEVSDGRISILDLAGGKPQIVDLRDWNDLTSVGWSADGKSLFATNWSSLAGSILHVALNGETHLLHRAAGMTLEKPVSSPDGRYLRRCNYN